MGTDFIHLESFTDIIAIKQIVRISFEPEVIEDGKIDSYAALYIYLTHEVQISIEDDEEQRGAAERIYNGILYALGWQQHT